MKKDLLLLLLIFPIFGTCQEELFLNQNGFALSHIQTFENQENGSHAQAVTAYINKSVTLSAGIGHVADETYGIAGIGLISKPDMPGMPVRFALGLTFANISGNSLLGFGGSILRNFLPETKFPFALSAQISTQTFISGSGQTTTTVGLNYMQGLFAKKNLYPHLGIGAFYDIKNERIFFPGIIGLNIVLNSNKAEMPANKQK